MRSPHIDELVDDKLKGDEIQRQMEDAEEERQKEERRRKELKAKHPYAFEIIQALDALENADSIVGLADYHQAKIDKDQYTVARGALDVASNLLEKIEESIESMYEENHE